jgi:hypothetical protein
MRFFDTNWLFENFGGTITASSGAPAFAFDEDNQFSWVSNGQGTDGTSVNITRTLESTSTINAIFIKNTNISNISVEVDIGAGLVSLATASTFTLTKSADGTNYWYQLDNSIDIDEIKISGSNTINANEEKSIAQILSFEELGQVKNIDSIKPKIKRIQKISKLNSGKKDIIDKGRYFEFALNFKTHYKSDDNTILETLLDREESIWLWINDDSENVQVMSQQPFRFQDIYKVSIEKDNNIDYTKNLFFSGINIKLNLTEVA